MNIYELSDEEKAIVQKHRKLKEEGKEEERLFWEIEYPKYSFERKVMYWLADIHRGMRCQGEATADEYSKFSPVWYEYVKSKDNNFDSVFAEVVPKLGMDFDWQEYHKRIRKYV